MLISVTIVILEMGDLTGKDHRISGMMEIIFYLNLGGVYCLKKIFFSIILVRVCPKFFNSSQNNCIIAETSMYFTKNKALNFFSFTTFIKDIIIGLP